ncbi:MAG: nucleotide exchange factor GrpE [Spirochaetota bacterium]
MPNDGEARDEATLPEEQASLQESPDANSEAETADVDAPSESEGEVAPENTVEQLELELADLRNQLLRKSADFDNYRKRMQREKEEFAAYANRELLQDIVPIIDDFERAIKSGEESEDFSSFHDGIVMIEKQFTSMLERKWKLQRFDSEGEEFDPQRHEAMMTEDSSEVEHPTVLEDFQKGYLLNERVLRPAKVKVAMPVAAETEAAEESEDSEAGT